MNKAVIFIFIVLSLLCLTFSTLAEEYTPKYFPTAIRMSFKPTQKVPIFSDPNGEFAVPLDNGNAFVDTTYPLDVFGEEDGWLLVECQIAPNTYRIGYVKKALLNFSEAMPKLQWKNQEAWNIKPLTVTDDPLHSKHVFDEGSVDRHLHYLATLGDWAYVENIGGDAFRGFVPLDSITFDRIYALEDWQARNDKVLYSGTITVKPDGLTIVDVSIPKDSELYTKNVTALQLIDHYTLEVIAECKINQRRCTMNGTLHPRAYSFSLKPIEDNNHRLYDYIVELGW